MAIKRAKKVRLECGLEISKEFYDNKRANHKGLI